MLKKLSVLLMTFLIVNQCAFAYESEKMTRFEYTKALMDQYGITLLDVKSKSDVSVEEKYLYTALNKGFLNGVSYKFDEYITEEEKAIVLENIKSQIGIQTVESVESERVSAGTEDNYDFMTPYGELRAPSNMHPNEAIWSDEEFHNQLVNNKDELWDTISYNIQWKYDEDTRHFNIDVSGTGHQDYFDVDEVTDGALFDLAKAVIYHAQQTGLHVSLMNFGEGRGVFYVRDEERGFKNIKIYFVYDARKRDMLYDVVPEYEVGTTNLMHEWYFKSLFDTAVYEDEGYEKASMTTEEAIAVRREYKQTEQSYTDFVYGVCDYLYEDDGFSIFKYIVGEYMNGSIQMVENDAIESESSFFETENYNIYKYSPYYTRTDYGISLK